MPAYYNEDTKKWYCKFYYKDWQGIRKQKKKSGFERKKDALEWERSFLDKLAGSPDMAFSDFCEIYLDDLKKRVRLQTYSNIKRIINTWIIPYFSNMAVFEIKPLHIRKWQNTLKETPSKRGTPLSIGTIRLFNTRLSCIFNFGVKYYGFTSNPVRITGNIPDKVHRTVDFWTKDEFDRFIDVIDKKNPYYIIFNVLYYTGMRIGELQALTFADLDLKNGIIHITKTMHFETGKGRVVGEPKTAKSNRDISIPSFLCELLDAYEKRFYKPCKDTILFNVDTSNARTYLIRHAVKAGVKSIRIHDLRHSHASLLIDLGFSVLLISERLGHEDPSITLKIYSHLFPSRQDELTGKLDVLFWKSDIK